ncbi:MAG: tRNA 2-thiouridine(34) synthase MnmA [Patescibacteria group bacterium]|nr:tRNA 2-thiouridine(34) synthase MnmA [Patescibacteria group bacterium]MDE2015651.1 tRNA 2-thiouridine(34) synthase MnmA [Patescibacteria group bacterium]MDE2226708.1 tRNA 2-thiouridine(34) synthase MnmA [Patescibacteria group bacterium]
MNKIVANIGQAPKQKVFVAMSGGVDSSVAALLLQNDGYDVVGVFMKCYNLDGCAERDAEDARRVAQKLDIPFYAWDFEKEYKEKVVDYMIEGYRQGITPNPDVMCNKEIKFGLFFKKAMAMGADFIATGHYVRLKDGRLYQAVDNNKDQSYFLWTLTQEQLPHCLFPIGDYIKSKVREIARQAGLPTADKKDSQGICFLGKISVDDFLKQYIPERRGAVITAAGKKIGEHSGAEFYTIGQRHIDADIVFPKTGKTAERQPLYVSEKNVKDNTVTVAEGKDNQALYKKEIHLAGINFMSGALPKISSLTVLARVRYRQPLGKAVLNGTTLTFEQPQKFVAVGQSVVFYLPSETLLKEGSLQYEMLGGGIIL